MIKDFFKIIENHYLYRDFNDKFNNLKKCEEFNNFINDYIKYYTSMTQENLFLLNLLNKSSVINEGQDNSSNHLNIQKEIQFEGLIIKTNVEFKNKINFYEKGPNITTTLLFSISIENSMLLTVNFNVEQEKEKTYHRMSFGSLNNGCSMSHSIFVEDRTNKPNSIIEKINLESVHLIGYPDNNGKINSGYTYLTGNLNHKRNKSHPELSCLNDTQISQLLLKGGLDSDTVELLKLTTDFGNSMDNYIKDKDDTIFNLIEKNKMKFDLIKKQQLKI